MSFCTQKSLLSVSSALFKIKMLIGFLTVMSKFKLKVHYVTTVPCLSASSLSHYFEADRTSSPFKGSKPPESEEPIPSRPA